MAAWALGSEREERKGRRGEGERRKKDIMVLR
jgi:hypothetical protein